MGPGQQPEGNGFGEYGECAEDEDGPDEGRAALYTGMASYVRCIEVCA